MKTKTILYSTLIITSLISCEGNENELNKIKQTQLFFSSITNKHTIHSDILDVLNDFSNNDKIKIEKNQELTKLIYDSTQLIYSNNKIHQINTPKAVYKILDGSIIETTYIINGQNRTGKLVKGNYNGVYVAYNEESIMEINFVNNDTISRNEIFKNGKLKSNVNYQSNNKQGLYSEFYSNGEKKLEVEYLDGKRNSTYFEWFENNKLKTKVLYVNGLKIGEQVHFFKEVASMKQKTFYKEGKKEGVEMAWYPNAKGHYTANYKNGKLEGEAIVYQENKNLMSMKGIYKENMRNGLFNVWDDNGSGIYSAEYEYDQLMKIIKGTKDDEITLFDIEDVLFTNI